MKPRSLASKLFAAIAGISIVAMLLGTWLVQRAVRVEVDEHVTVAGDSAGREVTRIVKTIERTEEGSAARASQDAMNRRLLLALGLLFGGASIATMLIARQIVRPLTSLRSAADAMAQGNLAVRVDVRTHDELGALGTAFNSMAAQLQSTEQRRRDLTNDVAHELRTPLTTLRCHLEALQDGVARIAPDTVSTLLGEVIDVQTLVDDLGDLARAEAGQLQLSLECVSMADVAARLSSELQPRLDAAALTLTFDVAAGCDVRADPTRLLQVLRNLLDNAIRHTPSGGRIDVRVQRSESSVRIDIADTGCGVAPEHLPHIFERFYRPDPSRSRETGGAGLGLAIVRQMVHAHGGTVRAESDPGRGLRVIVEWPALRQAQDTAFDGPS